MKVFIVTNTPFPNGMAPANRISCYAKALSYEGIESEILIYRRTERYGFAPNNIETQGYIEDVCYRYIPNTTQRGANVLYRKIHDIIDKYSLLKELYRRMRVGDVLFLYISSDTTFAIILCVLAHIKKIKCSQDLCELPSSTTKESLRNKLKRFEEAHFLFPLLNGIIPISDGLVDYAKNYVSKRCKIIKVPIMVDYDEYDIKDNSTISERSYIFHAGTLTEQKDGILGIVKAFALASKQIATPILLICTGKIEDSREAEELKTLITENNLEEKVLFVGYLSFSEMKQYLSEATIVIINKYNTTQNHYCFSTKLGEYMAAGKPIIITRVGEAVNWLRDGVDCIMVQPGDDSELAASIMNLFLNPNLRWKLSSAAKQQCRKHFDYRSVAVSLSAFFKSL